MKSIINQLQHIMMRDKIKMIKSIMEINIEKKKKIQTKYNKIYLPYN